MLEYNLPNGRQPWPLQVKGCEETVAAIESGCRRVCLTSPTGTGKATMILVLIEWAVQQGWPVVLFSHRKILLDQLAETLRSHHIHFGVVAAGHEEEADASALVQLCSIQTVSARVVRRREGLSVPAGRLQYPLPPARLVLIDELHVQKAATATAIFAEYVELGASTVGLTATPLGVSHLADELIVAGNNSDARACGALVLAKVFACPEIDMSSIEKVVVGEFSVNDIKKVWCQAIYGHVLTHYRRLNPDDKPFLLFAPGVEESINFAKEFSANGIPAAHIDGEDVWVDGEFHNSSSDVREDVLRRLKSGDIKGVCNRFVCLDNETEILTDTGWVGIDDMTGDHNVANWDAGRVYFERPTEVIRRPRAVGEKMVVLETPRRSIRVTADHELLFRTTMNGRFLKSAAAELVGRSIALPVSGIADPIVVEVEQPIDSRAMARRIASNAYALRSRGFDAATSSAEAKHRIADRASLRRKAPHELTEEECEFIGFWIGDGNRSRLASGGIEYRLTQSLKCPNIVARIEALIATIEVDSIRRTKVVPDGMFCAGGSHATWSLPRGTGFGPQKRRGLFAIEHYLEKDGTDLFWGLSESQFTALLRGLWMADGSPHNDDTDPGNGFSICGANYELFDLLQAIAVCRGWRASIRSYAQSNPKYQPLLHLTLSKTEEHRMTKYRLQFEEGSKQEDVWCVRVRSGNIITRRRGSVTVMGNCREGVDLPYLEHLILATPIGSLLSYIQIVGRVLRSSPGLTDVTIQDHGGGWWRHGSPNADRDDIWRDYFAEDEYMPTKVRAEKIRDGEEEPAITCPKCHALMGQMPSSRKCYRCGQLLVWHQTRTVIQRSGKLVDVTGIPIKAYKKVAGSLMERAFASGYFSAKRYKPETTFAAIRGFICSGQKNGYEKLGGCYPDGSIPFTPTNPRDWFKTVGDVPMSALVPKIEQPVLFKPGHPF